MDVKGGGVAGLSCSAARDGLHHSLRSVAARPRAIRCVAFLANSRAIGKPPDKADAALRSQRVGELMDDTP
jgi:hypothetical protein